MSNSRRFRFAWAAGAALVAVFLATNLFWRDLEFPGVSSEQSPVAPPQPAPMPAPVLAAQTELERVPAGPPPNSSAVAAPLSRPAVPARMIFGAAWKKEADPRLRAFSTWTDRYLEASEADRANLLAEGVELARERRTALAELIRNDPEAALAAAVPVAVRNQLPSEIEQLLEARVSGRGELALLAVTPKPGQAVAEPLFRSALVGGNEYRAFTYGHRATLGALTDVPINGVAVDRLLAVSDSPVRVLEPGEAPSNRPVENICETWDGLAHPTQSSVKEARVLVESGGVIQSFCCAAHMIAYESHLQPVGRSEKIRAANNQPGSSGITGRPSPGWTHGTKTVLIIRVDFSDRPGTPANSFDGQILTEDYAVSRFNEASGVRDYFERNSFGKTSLQIRPTVGGDSPDVTGLLRMPATSAYYATNEFNLQLHSDARALAGAAGFDVANYDRVGVVFADLDSIPGSNIHYGGLGDVIGPNFWMNGWYTFSIVAHEIGHTYGLHHANLWQVTDGNPVSPAGSSVEYGDLFDLMGDGNGFENHVSHLHKSLLEWLPHGSVTTVSNSGTYRVFRFDHPAPNFSNALALKIVRDDTRDYWIGYRRATGSAALENGAYVLWGYNENRVSDLLDLTTPGNDPGDAPLAVGAVFNDAAAGITLQPTAIGGAGGADQWLDVRVAFQPRIQWEKTTVYADENSGVATLTLTRNNNASGAVSVTFTTVAGSAVAPEDFTPTNGVVSWADGDAAPRVITLAITPDGAPEGTEQFGVALSNPAGGVIVGTNTATVFVTEPGTFDPEFMPRFVNHTVERVAVLPDGKVLAAGWFTSVSARDFQNYTKRGIARFTADGELDTNFPADGEGISAPSDPRVEDLARQPDGKILIAGNFTAVNGTPRNHIARLNPDGSVDPTFDPGTGADAVAHAVLVLPDGTLLLGGEFTSFNGVPREYLVRLDPRGAVDAGFAGPDFGSTSGWSVESLALQPDGKILVGGVFYFEGAVWSSGLCRLNPNGALDPTFDGVVDGAHVDGNLSQLSRVYRIRPLLDGTILIAGQFTAFNNTPRGGLARLNPNGSLDSFAPATDGECYAVWAQPDGNILVGGSFSTINGSPARRLARLTSTGALDPAFASSGGPEGNVKDLALQSDGRFVFGGDYGAFQGNDGPLWRFFSGLAELPGTVQWSSDAVIGVEGTTLTLTANRVGGAAGAVSVNFATVPGTAAPDDFTETRGTLSWADGESASRTVAIPIAADALAEPVESFTVNMGQPAMESTLLGAMQQAVVNIYTGYGAWQATHFTAVELSNPLISGDDADPDGDGIRNLLEYAYGLPPNTPDLGGTPVGALQSVSGTDYLSIRFRRRAPLLDLTYAPRASDSLSGPWTTNAVQAGPPVNHGDGTETVTFRDTVPVPEASQRFMRLDISRTP